MKKVAAGCFAVTGIVAVLFVIMLFVGVLRQEKVGDSAPMTMDELNKLARPADKPKADAPETASGTKEAGPPRATPAPANLPRRLNRCATDEERREEFLRGQSNSNKMIALVGSSPLGGFVDAIGAAAGIPGSALANRGECYLLRCNWAAAKSCYSQYVRESDDPLTVQYVYSHLAWLEDDPEIAARYMELAAEGPQVGPVAMCRNLARQTGSEQLYAHYARLFDEKQRQLQQQREAE